MQKFITTICLCFILMQAFGQTQKKVSAYLQSQYNHTIQDRTYGNNPWGIGLGLQAIFLNNKKTKFKPTIEFTADGYFADDKVLRLTPDDKPIDDVGSMINLFAGLLYCPTRKIYFSCITGPGFINRQTFLGVKPSFGFYFSNNHRWTGRISYINIFKRDKLTREDFETISLAIGLKLF